MIRILLITLLVVTAPVRAFADDDGLYTGAVTVTGQGAAERREALPQALAHVLRKLSGLRDLESVPGIADALQRAPALLVTFYYRTIEHPMPDGAVRTELRLMARFAEPGVDDLVRQLQLPLWPPQRRPAEIWLVIDDGDGRQILPAEFDYLRFALDDAAGLRGLRLDWPQPDEEGMYPVDLQLLWGGYTEDLASPTGDGVLILTAGREGPLWNVRANLGYRGQNWSWRRQDYDAQAGLLAALQSAIDQVAAASAIASSDLGAWSYDLTVAGLAGPDDYATCLAWLQGLSIVERVSVRSAAPAQVTFRLGLTAMPRYLEDAIANGRVLEHDAEQDRYRMRGAVDER
ncbi:MAG: DUF2066 domain-containing protein [Xanthomonadales bacterium]